MGVENEGRSRAPLSVTLCCVQPLIGTEPAFVSYYLSGLGKFELSDVVVQLNCIWHASKLQHPQPGNRKQKTAKHKLRKMGIVEKVIEHELHEWISIIVTLYRYTRSRTSRVRRC